MSKAEERALEEYPEKFVMYGSYYGNGSEIKIDANAQYRNVYLQGFQQAEKDLELTWEDVSSLKMLLDEVESEFDKGQHEDKDYIGYCKEVLKRFKDFKERKEK